MFLNSSIGISEGVRATLFLRDCRKRNIIHRGGVDIKWNGPVWNFRVVMTITLPRNFFVCQAKLARVLSRVSNRIHGH